MPSLLIEAEGEEPRTVRIERFPCRIGRAPDSDILLPGWRVGKLHAELQRIARGIRLMDCGTLAGTLVNGERVAEHAPLLEVDEIRIVGWRLRLLAQEGEPTPIGSAPGMATPARPTPDAPHRPVISSGAAEATMREWRRLFHRRLLQTIDLRRRDIRQLSPEQLRAEARGILQELIDTDTTIPRDLPREALREEVLDEAVGLGPLERLMIDPEITEIMVNGPAAIWVERQGRLNRSELAFSGEQAVRSVIDRIVAPVGRRIDESSPMVDARLPDGSRVNAIVPPLAVRGAALTIRRFNRRVLAPDDLVALGSASTQMVALLRSCVTHRRNVVISGGTGSGKTTLLNVLSNLIPEEERVVTIEDAAELRLDHEHLVALEARPSNAEGRGAVTIRDLVRNALRMRPDRIVVGECRGGEALDMLQAMNTGHEGSLTTVHANAPRDVIARLETMVLMAGMDLPVSAIRDQIASAVHLVVQQARGADGQRRIVEIAEITGVEGARVLMQPIYRWEGGRFVATGAIPLFVERLRAAGVDPAWSPDAESGVAGAENAWSRPGRSHIWGLGR